MASTQGRSKASTASQPGEVKSVALSPQLVQEQGVGNLYLLLGWRIYGTINPNQLAGSLRPTRKISLHILQKRMGEILSSNVWAALCPCKKIQVNGFISPPRCQRPSSVPCPHGPHTSAKPVCPAVSQPKSSIIPAPFYMNMLSIC